MGVQNFVTGVTKNVSGPDAEGAELGGGLAGPITVGQGRSRAGMEDLADLHRRTFGDQTGAVGGEFADADEPLGLKDLEDGAEMGVAGGGEQGRLGGGEFVGGAIAGAFKKGERTIIDNKVPGEEIL